jgi:hypothetical protein
VCVSNEPGSRAAARDASIARVRNLTRGAVVCAAALSGAVAGLAVTSTHARKTAHPLTRAAHRSPTAVPAAVPAPPPSSAEVPVPVAPTQAPSQSVAPPVASSGGS